MEETECVHIGTLEVGEYENNVRASGSYPNTIIVDNFVSTAPVIGIHGIVPGSIVS
ncbi:MAG: hypothetical protein LBP35_06205 [Candidatus Ancillula trichonymphae]|jgi:hypothetical protein|nr:hypothetical protein [Candidatus Ancillula trichonymphae]